MRILILTLLLISGAATSQDYQPGVTYLERGDTYGSDGTTIRWRGSTMHQGPVTGYQRGKDLYRSDGLVERWRGNDMYRSDGLKARKRGNNTYYSNGVTCYQRGKTLSCY